MGHTPASDSQGSAEPGDLSNPLFETLMTSLVRWPAAVAPRYFYGRYRASLAVDQKLQQLRVPEREPSASLEAVYVPPRLAEREIRYVAIEEDVKIDDRGSRSPNGAGRGGLRKAAAITIENAMLRSSRIALLGGPGSGKTTLLCRLALMVLQGGLTARYIRRLTVAHQDRAMDTLVPIFVSLPRLAEGDGAVMPHLIEVFSKHGFPHAGSFLDQRLSEGQCLLLLDGLDAIDGHQKRRRVLDEIQALSGRYGERNQILVSSRLAGYQGELEGFAHLELLPFDQRRIESFVRRWFGERSEHAGRLLATLEHRPEMHAMAGNPLLLSLLTVACERMAVADVRGVRLYDTVVEILLREEHDHVLRTSARRLAYQAQAAGRDSFSKQVMSSILRGAQSEGLVGSAAVETVVKTLVEDTDLLQQVTGGAFGFAHRALQQYLAAEAVLERDTPWNLAERAGDDRYHEVIPLVAGLQGDATDLIGALMSGRDADDPHRLLLAGKCLREADETDEELRKQVRDGLFGVFEGGEPELWRETALTIAGIEGLCLRDAFAGFLRSGDAALRAGAAKVLGCLREEWGVTFLIAALGDEAPEVRSTAAWALGRLGDNRAVYSLVKLLGDDGGDVLRQVTVALGAMGEPALQPLAGALGHGSDSISSRAARALGALGPVAIPVLLGALKDDREPPREEAVQALARMGSGAIDALVDCLDAESPRLRRGAVRVLCQIGEPETVAAAVRALGDADDRVRLEAAEMLRKVGPSVVKPLIEALMDDQRWVSAGAADLLTELGDPAVDGLIEALRGDRRALRYAAAKVLGTIGAEDPSVVLKLGAVLNSSRAEVRQTAVRALAQMGNDAAIDLLVGSLETEEEALRRASAQALVSLGGEGVVRKLREAFQGGADPQRVVRILSRIETRFARDFLRELLQSEDSAIRNLAAFALESDERSGLYYYRAWERSIEERLLKQGAATAAMLHGTPSELRPVVLQRYVSSHPEMDLTYDAEMDVLYLNAIDRYKRLADHWERATQNIDGNSELSGQIFAECVKGLTAALCDILELKVVRGEVSDCLHCFVLQVSPIIHGTNLPPEIPLVFLRRQELDESDLDDLRELLAKIRVFHRTALLVLFNDGEVVQQADQLADEKLRDVHAFDVIIFGKKDLQRVVTAKKPQQALRFAICEQADLTLVSPYSCDEPASRNLFFGREFEVRTTTQAIVNNSVAILGGRRIGKTSILHRVNEVLRESYSCHYLDCHPIRDYRIFFRTMAYHWPQLGSLAPEPVSFHAVMADLQNDRMLVFVFDEIDALLRFDMDNEELLFKTFRSLSQEGLCRFIFSGERVLSNQLKYGSASPLFNFCGQRIQLGYLERSSARQLITEPMSWMNIELRDQEPVVDAIVELTSCHPRLVQYVCHSLVKEINHEGVRYITPEHVRRVADSNEYREEFLYTVWGDATPFEKALTLALDRAKVTMEGVHAALRKWEIAYTWDTLKSALHNLKTCSVLVQENDTFHFVPGHFPRIARESLDIEMEIGSLKRRIRREQNL